jgi:hypothetical protein
MAASSSRRFGPGTGYRGAWAPSRITRSATPGGCGRTTASSGTAAPPPRIVIGHRYLPRRLASRGCGVGVEQSGDRRIAAQPVQAAAAAWPDAPDRDAQPSADLGVRHGWILHEHGDQPLAAWGRRVNASCSAVCRSPVSSSCSAMSVCWPGMCLASGTRPRACDLRVARRIAPHSRWVAVASQPGSAAGSWILSSWLTSCSQTLWPTSSASALLSRCLRQMDQISGAYRSKGCPRPTCRHLPRGSPGH